MNPTREPSTGLDSVPFLLGILLGFLVGGLVMLFRPRQTNPPRQSFPPGAATPDKSNLADPAAESLAQGKAAARRRRAELGIKRNS